MGGVCGKSPHQLRYERSCEPLLAFYDKLGITHAQGKKLYKVYEEMDADNSGTVQLDEFFDHFNLDFTPFAENAFKQMDIDKGMGSNLSLDFAEFFVGMWNYCTMNHKFLVKFAFDLFDDDGSGEIDKQEIHSMIRMVLGKRKQDKTIMKFVKSLDKDGSGLVSLDEFVSMNRKMPSLLMPAWDLQRKLRERVCGASYWDKATRMRLNKMGDKDLIEFYYYLRTGGKLERKTLSMEAVMMKEGVVKADVQDVVGVFDMPNNDAKQVKTLNPGDKVTVYEDRTDSDHQNSDMWFLIDAKSALWVKSEYIKLDATWLKHEAMLKRKEKMETEKKEEAARSEEQRADELEKLKQTWSEARDDKTKRKYWYNVNTSETTWKNPFKAYEKKK